ncbi:VOC family protein [Bacillus horti]|uniref:Catechol 2,3-dioxygenase-like lactoylglutathione lyase family enzyme n=1 Tax=Caldalkalibacillus horti TaxID=77523 RepID=A0ABT9VVA0_9BACI|nr:VOC family protein [Bacillus horti]MDQ0164911.1 catechol 2,3-dioxygenase-like lactoylglutathione lyase family enzyme [Bacillus horti]
MEGNVMFYFVPVKDIKSAKALYRDALGLEESWREGDFTVAFKLPGTDVELMVEQVQEGGPDAAGPVLLVPSVKDIYENNQGKLHFVDEPSETPDGLWVSAKDDSGNGIYFTDESKHE